MEDKHAKSDKAGSIDPMYLLICKPLRMFWLNFTVKRYTYNDFVSI